MFAVTRIFSLSVDVKFVLNHREEFLYLNNVMNPIIYFVMCKSARDDVKTFLLMIASRVCRRSQRGSSRAIVETGTGNRANITHATGVTMTTEFAAGANVDSNRANTECDTGAGMNETSDTDDMTKRVYYIDVKTNEGSDTVYASNQGSDKGARSIELSDICSSKRQKSVIVANSSESSDKGASARKRSDPDAGSSKESDKGASARKRSDTDASSGASSDKEKDQTQTQDRVKNPTKA